MAIFVITIPTTLTINLLIYMRNRGGIFTFINYAMHKENYKKLPKTYQQQIEFLKDRGLSFDNEKKAIAILKSISYYRLSAYWYPLLKHPKNEHQFKENSTFEQAFSLYQFDSELRQLLFGAIEQIEIALRTQLIYQISHHEKTGFWTDKFELFSSYKGALHQIQKIHHASYESEEEFIVHYKSKYSNWPPPSWISLELTTFRTVSGMYKNLSDLDLKNKISEVFRIKYFVLESWLETLVYIRNVCAHHSRLWNKTIPKQPKWSKIKNDWVSKWENSSENGIVLEKNKSYKLKCYAVLCIIMYLLNKINPENDFKNKLFGLLENYETIDVAHMGFPKDWKSEELWN